MLIPILQSFNRTNNRFIIGTANHVSYFCQPNLCKLCSKHNREIDSTVSCSIRFQQTASSTGILQQKPNSRGLARPKKCTPTAKIQIGEARNAAYDTKDNPDTLVRSIQSARPFPHTLHAFTRRRQNAYHQTPQDSKRTRSSNSEDTTRLNRPRLSTSVDSTKKKRTVSSEIRTEETPIRIDFKRSSQLRHDQKSVAERWRLRRRFERRGRDRDPYLGFEMAVIPRRDNEAGDSVLGSMQLYIYIYIYMLSFVRVYSSAVGSAYVQFAARGLDPTRGRTALPIGLGFLGRGGGRESIGAVGWWSEGGEGGKTVISLVFARVDFAAISGGRGRSHPLGIKWLIFGKIFPSHFELENLN